MSLHVLKKMMGGILRGAGGRRGRTLEGKEFIVEAVAGVKLEEFVGSDDERVDGGVLGNLQMSISLVFRVAQKKD
jgi:hypothetical protein